MDAFIWSYLYCDRQTDRRTDGKSNYISPTGRSNNESSLVEASSKSVLTGNSSNAKIMKLSKVMIMA